MIKKGDILELKIEKNVFEGYGLAHFEGMAVFVKGVIEGECALVEIGSVQKKFAKGTLVEIKEESIHRIKPKCPLNKLCGSCDIAYIDYDFSADLKEKTVKEIFKDYNVLPIIKSKNPFSYRSKAQYPVCETKKSKRIIAGYYKEKTHEIINIKFCPVQPLIFDKIIEFVRQNWKWGAYDEKSHKGSLKHINLKTNEKEDEILLTLVLNQKDFDEDLSDFINALIAQFPQIKGVALNFNPNKTNKITGDKLKNIYGDDYIISKVYDSFGNEYRYKTGHLSFFQINLQTAGALFDCAKKMLEKGTLLDLYGGAGAISIFMKDKATKITLVEQNPDSIRFAKENFKLNNVPCYEVFEGKAEDITAKFIKDKKKFDNIVIDPPRKGSDPKTLETISKMTNFIIYISCNPMTLKRDADILKNYGFELLNIQPVDMFPNTHHIECVSCFKRSGE